MRLHRSVTALAALLALAACEKNAVQDLTGPLPTARIRFFNFGVNAPGVHFYAGDTKVTATTSSLCPLTSTDPRCTTTGIESTAGITYGGVGSGGLYSGVQPGQYTFASRLASNQTTVTSNVPLNVVDGKHYSYYISGFYNTATQSADAFIVEDNFPAAINWNVATIRFVNAISNSQPMTLYARNTETAQEYVIGGAVAYKAAGAFTDIPPGSYDLSTRVAGASTNAIVRTNVAFAAGRTYTIAARGDMTVTSTTATNRPFLDFTANR